MNDSRIAVTGMGIISPLGFNLNEHWNNLCSGHFKLEKVEFPFWKIQATQVLEVNAINKQKLADFIPPHLGKKMDYFVAYSLIAAQEAIHEAGLEEVIAVKPNRIGLSIGSTFGGIGYAEKEYKHFLDYVSKGSYPKVSAYLSIAVFQCAASGQVSIANRLKGKIYALPNGNTSGIDSIFNAVRVLKANSVDIMLAGSSESPVTPYCISSMHSLGKLNQKSENLYCCSPFTGTNDGFLLGEGSGLLTLERFTHAQNRNASIMGEIAGCYGIVDKDIVSAGEKCLNRLFKISDIDPTQIDFIVAYGEGTGTDQQELEVLKRVFGDNLPRIPITAIKPLTGNALAASSAFEVIFGISCLNNNVILPIRKAPERNFLLKKEVHYVEEPEYRDNLRTFLTYSINFKGKFSAVIIKKVI